MVGQRFFLSLSCSVLCAGLAQAQVGSAVQERWIGEGLYGFTGALDSNDFFGESMASLGDLDGNGVNDLAVGAEGDDDGGSGRGAVWILFLNADGSVASQTKISQTSGGFTGALLDGSRFGRRVAALGDVDGDGVADLATTSGLPQRLWILFLNRDGTVRAHGEIPFSDPVFGVGSLTVDFLEGGLDGLGDVNGDGVPDLAWGAPEDDDGDEDAGAVWIVHLNAAGGALSAQKIAQGSGGFIDDLQEDGYFSSTVIGLGDVDGNGTPDLGVKERYASVVLQYPGKLWILFLDASEQVIGTHTLTTNDFDASWNNGTTTAGIGHEFDTLGDLDGDGIEELAMGLYAFRSQGGFVIAFLAADGSVRKRLLAGSGSGGVSLHQGGAALGSGIAALGDLDGDGTLELAVSDPYLDLNSPSEGSVFLVSLDTSPVRNGSGLNPLTLGESADPALGQLWSASLDCSGHASGLAILSGWNQKIEGNFLPAGEVLVVGTRLFQFVAPHAGGPVVLGTPVPNDLVLLNLAFSTQGLCSGAPGLRLSNALDVLVGR